MLPVAGHQDESILAAGGVAQEDLPHVPNILAIEDMLPRNVGIVVRPWTKVQGLASDSYTGHRTRHLPGADGELLGFVSVKETLSECGSRQASPGRLGGPHQTAVASRCARPRTRLFSDARCDSLITAVLEKDTRWNPRNAQAAFIGEVAHHQEAAKRATDIQGYTGAEFDSGIIPNERERSSSVELTVSFYENGTVQTHHDTPSQSSLCERAHMLMSDSADAVVSAVVRTTTYLTSLYFTARFDYSQSPNTFMDALSATSEIEYLVLSAHWTTAEPPGVPGQYIWRNRLLVRLTVA
ncbi:hypothetical protein HPB50_027935 [Hyalomma asiaticum]|nr:hypothetical protein HPB50_027935 [Hyalomma asiaticum]